MKIIITGVLLALLSAFAAGVQAQCPGEYTRTFSFTGHIERFIVPTADELTIVAIGGSGGGRNGGLATRMQGRFALGEGQVLNVMVGAAGGSGYGHGGGGGSFVTLADVGNETLIIAAGGGGGAGDHDQPGDDACPCARGSGVGGANGLGGRAGSSGGGGGYLSGGDEGIGSWGGGAYLNGAAGGVYSDHGSAATGGAGGYGGGGAGRNGNGGGGGGFSGGGGIVHLGGGGGGGSFNVGTDQNNALAAYRGDGMVMICAGVALFEDGFEVP